MFARLNQTLEGLFKISSSALSFATVLHDSHVQNFKMLRRRRDVVFSQAVSACTLRECLECARVYLSILANCFSVIVLCFSE